MAHDRGRSRTLPQEPEQPMQRREQRRSARPFQAAPLVPVDEETEEGEEPKESKTRRFFRAIGFGCFMSKGKNDPNGSDGVRGGRFSRFSRRGPALRAITIEDARYAFNQNMLESEDGSVYSTVYERPPYQLFLGTENKTDFKPSFARDPPKPGEPQVMDLSDLRPSMNEREMPVFFVPPPADIVASVTPRRRLTMTYVSPPDSPKGAYA